MYSILGVELIYPDNLILHNFSIKLKQFENIDSFTVLVCMCILKSKANMNPKHCLFGDNYDTYIASTYILNIYILRTYVRNMNASSCYI